jgi:hypothetical protein
MAHAVDLLVDRAFLLDVGIGARNISFRLIVIVVGNEILDRVVGKEALELAVELGSQRLVGRKDEGRALGCLDHLGHGEGLARAGDAEQHLFAFPGVDSGDDLGDGLGLIALRLIIGDDAQAPAALAFLGTRRTVGDEFGELRDLRAQVLQPIARPGNAGARIGPLAHGGNRRAFERRLRGFRKSSVLSRMAHGEVYRLPACQGEEALLTGDVSSYPRTTSWPCLT